MTFTLDLSRHFERDVIGLVGFHPCHQNLQAFAVLGVRAGIHERFDFLQGRLVVGSGFDRFGVHRGTLDSRRRSLGIAPIDLGRRLAAYFAKLFSVGAAYGKHKID